MPRRNANWISLSFDTWLLGLEVAQVVWLRSCLVALGGAAAERETRRMIEEKMVANMLFGWRVATGHAGASPEAAARTALSHYGPRVRANRRRLTTS
jgi:hypothetical protein